jgi:hypothetical protein
LSASQSGLRTLLGLIAELAPDSFRIGQEQGPNNDRLPFPE